MFDLRRITVFCLEKRLSKHKMIIFSNNLGGTWRLWPAPVYAYGLACEQEHTLLCVDQWFLTGVASINFQGGTSPDASCNMENVVIKLINLQNNAFVFAAYLKPGGLKQRTNTYGRRGRKRSRITGLDFHLCSPPNSINETEELKQSRPYVTLAF